MVPAGNKTTPFGGQPYHKNNSSSSIDLFLSFVVNKSMLYPMLKKPPRCNRKLVLAKDKHKNTN